MIQINGKPFLEYQIENLKKNEISDIVLCVGHLSEKIESYFGKGERFGVNIKYSHDGEKLLGPMGAVKNAESLLENNFFIMYGDSYLTLDFKKVHSFFIKENKLGLMVVYKNFNKFDKSNLIVENNLVTAYGENNRTKEMIYIDYGTSVIRKKSLDLIPIDEYFTTGQFFVKLIENKELLAFEADNRFYHIGNPESLEELRNYIKNR
jgi:NDP-sugar pyrophosphorylase family protein